MGLPIYEPLVAVVASVPVAIVAVRALGQVIVEVVGSDRERFALCPLLLRTSTACALLQTDINPVSGVGKLAQLIFAVVAPGDIVSNLVAGAVAEAGAQQAGDLLQVCAKYTQANEAVSRWRSLLPLATST
jgi:hypothetical protein